jgi:hypothetical protein
MSTSICGAIGETDLEEERQTPEVMQVELASLVHLIGGMAPKHLVAVGGLVPPLLVPEASKPHRGSADIDLSMSMAITKGETSEYYRSLEKSIEPFFEPFAAGFRWRKRADVPGVRVVVDFLGPDDEATHVADGTMDLENERAVANTGIRLRPFPLAAAAIVEEDAHAIEIERVPLVYQPGVFADVTIRHTGPVGFFASKADALASRGDPKDGYDISWVSLHAGESPEEVAAWIMECPAFKHEYFQESVAILMKAFRDAAYQGPSGYAQEMNAELGPGDETYEGDRNAAYLRVSRILAILRDGLWPE